MVLVMKVWVNSGQASPASLGQMVSGTVSTHCARQAGALNAWLNLFRIRATIYIYLNSIPGLGRSMTLGNVPRRITNMVRNRCAHYRDAVRPKPPLSKGGDGSRVEDWVTNAPNSLDSRNGAVSAN